MISGYLVSMDSEQGKQVASCIHLPMGIPADIHVCRPGYALPPDDARDSLPVVASPHQLLIGTPSRSVSTFGFVSVGPARAPSAGV